MYQKTRLVSSQGQVRMLKEWYQGVRKRREQRLRQIRRGFHFSDAASARTGTFRGSRGSVKGEDFPWNQPGKWMEEGKRKRESRFLIQAFVAFFLLTGTYLVFQSGAPAGKQAQQFISEVMNRDYNFAGVARWYQENVGGSPAILPTFTEKSQTKPSKKVQWVAPADGTLARPFRSSERGIVIKTAPQAPVVAASEGWVVEAGKKEGLGLTVILRHVDGRETWYGWLGEIRVKEKDWVQPRELLGKAGDREGQSYLYFALKEGNQFKDPTEVVSFE